MQQQLPVSNTGLIPRLSLQLFLMKVPKSCLGICFEITDCTVFALYGQCRELKTMDGRVELCLYTLCRQSYKPIGWIPGSYPTLSWLGAYLLGRLATFSQSPCSLGCHFLPLLNYQEAYICLLFYKNLSKISHLLMSPFFVCLLLQIYSLSIFNRSWDGASRRKWSLCSDHYP